MKKYSLKDLHMYADAKGGKCLSKQYEQSGTNYHWNCVEGHEWYANWNNVKNGSWCKKCSYKTVNKITGHKAEEVLSKMKNHAESLGGSCLSEIYINSHTKYQWRCKLGHEWEATWANIFHLESWCKKCSYKNPRIKSSGKQGSKGKRVKIEKIFDAARKKGGRILFSPEDYKDNKTKIKFECAKGHEFEANYNNIQQGNWCPFCANKRIGLSELKTLAARFGGEVVSATYLGVMRPHEWKCSEGHIFFKRPNSVKKGEWCSSCGDKVGERVCRATLEAIFQKPFPTLRPKWLAQGKSRMELDGYNEELGIAFEYHGLQHYEITYFSKTDEELKKRQEADQKKRELCKSNNVFLIEIPYKVSVFRIEGYIKRICIENHLENENYIDCHEPILKKAFLQTNLKRMQGLASLRGGKCVSPAYVHAHYKLEWECEKGHRWQAKPNYIQQGGWCPECAKYRRAVLMAGRRRKG